MSKISVVINTYNEEKNLPRAISSIKSLADEVIVVDMKSDDSTPKLAKKLGARVYQHERTGYVEPARNFAISKASNEWILLLDADEEIPSSLAKKIKSVVKKPEADYFRIPRKNIIFGKWIENTMWWPDYQIRLFKKGHVSWGREIHSFPITKGKGMEFEEKEEFAIIHHNYQSLTQFLERMHRYTTIQAQELVKEDYKFVWKDIIRKPLKEFINRFFVGRGYKDGLHGLALSTLQAFSEALIYLKIWESEKFLEQTLTIKETLTEFGEAEGELNWWLTDMAIKEKGPVKSLPMRVVRKLKNKDGKKKS